MTRCRSVVQKGVIAIQRFFTIFFTKKNVCECFETFSIYKLQTQPELAKNVRGNYDNQPAKIPRNTPIKTNAKCRFSTSYVWYDKKVGIQITSLEQMGHNIMKNGNI